MVKRVLIIGGYGNFGSYIARSLASDAHIQLVIGGRSLAKAQNFVASLKAAQPPEAIALDITDDIPHQLAEAKPDIVIHTTGPFQGQGYGVAEACLKQECHYIDLADARHFVGGITRYDQEARAKNLLVVSGASSVPCLTAAIIDDYMKFFPPPQKVEYGISAAQQTNRGLATASAIMSYVGKPFTTLIDGAMRKIYGWQNLHAEKYPQLGWRLFGNCDIPDLDLFPARYPALKTVRFSAGHELRVLHLGLWLLSWLVRWKMMASLEKAAPALLKFSFWCDAFGTDRSGFHMYLSDRQATTKKFHIIARSGHGPFIPCMPSILLAKGLADGTITTVGARPCLDLIDLSAYLGALKGLDISIEKEW